MLADALTMGPFLPNQPLGLTVHECVVVDITRGSQAETLGIKPYWKIGGVRIGGEHLF